MVSIRRYHHFLVAQAIYPVLYVQRMLQQVELLVLIHHLFLMWKCIQRFAPQAENCLSPHISAFGQTSTCAISFRYKNGAVQALLARSFVQVHTAVPQLFVVQVGLLGFLIGQFFYPCYLLPLPF